MAKLKRKRKNFSLEKATIELNYDSFATLFPRENSQENSREVSINDPLVLIDYLVSSQKVSKRRLFFQSTNKQNFSEFFLKRKIKGKTEEKKENLETIKENPGKCLEPILMYKKI